MVSEAYRVEFVMAQRGKSTGRKYSLTTKSFPSETEAALFIMQYAVDNQCNWQTLCLIATDSNGEVRKYGDKE